MKKNTLNNLKKIYLSWGEGGRGGGVGKMPKRGGQNRDQAFALSTVLQNYN